MDIWFTGDRYMAPKTSELWPETRVEKFKELFASGLSFSQIATELGDGLTRNACIGKAHRLGLDRPKPQPLGRPRRRKPSSDDDAKQRRDTHARLERQRWHRSKGKKRPAEPVVAEIEPENPISFFELEPHHCRFPVGEAVGANQLFCGQLKDLAFWPQRQCPYCEMHMRKAYWCGPRLREAA
jgi:GcrA cell cycle regulator